MVQLWYGYEPFLIRKERKKVMDQARNDSMNISVIRKFNEVAKQECFQVPLGGGRKIVFFELEDTKKPSKDLMEYVKHPCEDTDLYIVGNLDGRTELYKYLKQNNLIRKFNKAEPATLLKSVKGKLLRGGFTEEQVDKYMPLLQERLQRYHAEENYTMDKVLIQLEQLIYSEELSEEMIYFCFSEGVSEKVYVLSSYIFRGEKGKALTLMKELIEMKKSTPIAIGNTLLWQLRNCYKAALLKNSMSEKDILSAIGMMSFQLNSEYKQKEASYFLSVYEKVNWAVKRIKSGARCEVLYYAVADCF